jgi:hypothetical protein
MAIRLAQVKENSRIARYARFSMKMGPFDNQMVPQLSVERHKNFTFVPLLFRLAADHR